VSRGYFSYVVCCDVDTVLLHVGVTGRLFTSDC
jgi:hypothetical protein